MTRFLEALKAPFALEGSERLARRKRVRERGTRSVLELDSRPERVLEHLPALHVVGTPSGLAEGGSVLGEKTPPHSRRELGH